MYARPTNSFSLFGIVQKSLEVVGSVLGKPG